MTNEVDIIENDIVRTDPNLLTTLLKDHTTQQNIFWATSDYEYLGDGYRYKDPILPELITGERGEVIMPRVLKHKTTQNMRSREMAEVLTPSWICNAQNNLVDNAWFGKENVFNTETVCSDGTHTWITNPEKITFPEGRTWKDYVRDNRMEITCGEAPYITSRYDATTGELIPVEKRIGLLDRKLRVINENVHTSGEWLTAAQEAYKSIYGFEWQGDNLLLAREAMLYTFIENYELKFGKRPLAASIKCIAKIISWNVWQMDGLKGIVPNSCRIEQTLSQDLFGGSTTHEKICEGCGKGDIHRHNGIYCEIMDWSAGKAIKFVSLLNK